jgi:hypothetical protein
VYNDYNAGKGFAEGMGGRKGAEYLHNELLKNQKSALAKSKQKRKKRVAYS